MSMPGRFQRVTPALDTCTKRAPTAWTGALRPPDALELRLSLLEGEARRAALWGWPDRIGSLGLARPDRVAS